VRMKITFHWCDTVCQCSDWLLFKPFIDVSKLWSRQAEHFFGSQGRETLHSTTEACLPQSELLHRCWHFVRSWRPFSSGWVFSDLSRPVAYWHCIQRVCCILVDTVKWLCNVLFRDSVTLISWFLHNNNNNNNIIIIIIICKAQQTLPALQR